MSECDCKPKTKGFSCAKCFEESLLEEKRDKKALDFPEIKPPLGLKPRKVFENVYKQTQFDIKKERLKSLLEASLRYLNNDRKVLDEWLQEINDIQLELESLAKEINVIHSEKITDVFYPEEFKFKRIKSKDPILWEKINNKGRFLLYKTGNSNDSFYKIDANFIGGLGRTYEDVLIGSRKVAEQVFEKIGCLDD